METRLFVFVIAMLLLPTSCAIAQVPAWDAISYERWGFVAQVPAGSIKQDTVSASDAETHDVYASRGLVCIIRVTPAPEDLPTSTAIEQIIQAEVKAVTGAEPAKRWEQKSRDGSLFKGLVAAVHLDSADPTQEVVRSVVGSDSAFECSSMAPVSDDSSPILRLTVIGPDSRQNDIIATAMGMAAFVSKVAVAPNAADIIQPKPQTPAAGTRLKKGEIELIGVVKSVHPDGKSLLLTVEMITLPGAGQLTLSPTRPKTAVLKSKLPWLTDGVRVRVIGKNKGVGTPLNVDVIEPCPDNRPSNGPPRRSAPIVAQQRHVPTVV